MKWINSKKKTKIWFPQKVELFPWKADSPSRRVLAPVISISIPPFRGSWLRLYLHLRTHIYNSQSSWIQYLDPSPNSSRKKHNILKYSELCTAQYVRNYAQYVRNYAQCVRNYAQCVRNHAQYVRNYVQCVRNYHNVFGIMHNMFGIMYNVFGIMHNVFGIMHNMFGIMYNKFRIIHNLFVIMHNVFVRDYVQNVRNYAQFVRKYAQCVRAQFSRNYVHHLHATLILTPLTCRANPYTPYMSR